MKRYRVTLTINDLGLVKVGEYRAYNSLDALHKLINLEGSRNFIKAEVEQID